MVLAGFEHRPGVHCGSTALADALRVRGLDLSEAMVFGLGAGLGFYYVASPSLSPSHVFHGRSALLERTACEVLGAPADERCEEDASRAWEGVRSALERGFAPILSADSDRAGLQEVPLDVLDRARGSIAPPFGFAWCFRFGYQVIERRGTGGGAFRALYARFLAEAEALDPALARLGLSSRMTPLAAAWSRLAGAFRELSQAAGADVPPAVGELARDLARDERRYHEGVAARVV